MERLCDLLFELSNSDRVRILYHLKDTPDNITGVARDLKITTQETSRHITRLADVGLVLRQPDGSYLVSSYGDIVFNQMAGIEFSSTYRDYFKTHSLKTVPGMFVSRIGELRDCNLIENVMAVFQNIKEICDEAEEYIWRITDKRLNIIYPDVQEAADRGVEYRRIEPTEVNESPHVSILPPIKPGSVRGVESIPIFLAMSEKEIGGLAFPQLNNEFDYIGFTSKSPEALKWCRDLFQYYWDRGTEKTFNYKR